MTTTTTATCMHPNTCAVASVAVADRRANGALRLPALHHWNPLLGLASLGAWLVQGVHTWWDGRRQAEALRTMDLNQLRDVGAPDWLLQQATSRQAQECYEHVRAMSHLKY